MRIPISGGNENEALTAPGTDVRCILSRGTTLADFDGDGRVFELQSLEITNEHATQLAEVAVYDQDEAAAVAASQRLNLYAPAQDTVQYTWDRGKGPRFATNIAAGTTNGTIPAFGVRCGGELI